MDRSVWTDARLDDMVARTDSQFELLRAEMREGFRELSAGMVEIRGEMRDIRRDMFHGAVALFGSQLALFALLLARTL